MNFFSQRQLFTAKRRVRGRSALAVRGITIGALSLLLTTGAFAQDQNFNIFIAFGQSNLAGAGTIEAQDKTVDKRFQVLAPMDCSSLNRTAGKWYDAIPPLWGCPNGGLGPTDYFGRTMVKKLPTTIKVGVVVVGIPGCDIRLFDKKNNQGLEAYTYNYIPAKYNKSAYAWLLDLAKIAQKDGVIKGFLMHQGETMPNSANWTRDVKSVYDSLIADLHLDPTQIPLLAGEMLLESAGGESFGHNEFVHQLPDVIPHAHIIPATGLTGKDQWHFDAASERTFGARYADTMLTALDKIVAVRPSKLFVRGAAVNPVSFDGNAIQIALHEAFSFRITNAAGVLMESGKGATPLKAGAQLKAGVYFLAVAGSTSHYTERFFKRQ